MEKPKSTKCPRNKDNWTGAMNLTNSTQLLGDHSMPLRILWYGLLVPGLGLTNCSLVSNLHRNRLCPYPGVHAEKLNLLLHEAGIRFQLIVADTELFRQNYFFEAVYRSLHKGNETAANADTVLATHVYSPSVLHKWHLQMSTDVAPSSPLLAVGTAQTDMNQYKTAISIFQVYTPLIMLLIMVLLLVEKLHKNLITRVDADLRCQLASFRGKLYSSLLWLGGVSLLVIVLLSVYQKGLLVQLLNVKHNYAFDNFEQLTRLVQQGHVRLILVRTHLGKLHGNSKTVQMLKALKKHPPIVLQSLLNLGAHKSAIQNGSEVWLTDTDLHLASEAATWCNVRAVHFQDEIPTVYRGGYLFGKQVGRKLIDKVNKAIFSLTPPLLAIHSRYLAHANREQAIKCRSPEAKPGEDKPTQPMAMKNMIGVFMMLVTAAITGLLTLIMECLIATLHTYDRHIV